jgi:hypothetical protein
MQACLQRNESHLCIIYKELVSFKTMNESDSQLSFHKLFSLIQKGLFLKP